MYIGRDSSAICESYEVSIFILNKHGITKIKENFEYQYIEMKKLAIRRYKNHQVHIDYFLQKYLKFLEEAAKNDEKDLI